ncbi:hypothetical protein JANAI62_15370 [Jannaschia pagri]|uniref:N-(5'-phosphoribosyl)anthranilate isomerase n=1 Tax=Jannaschia pagri TaxID=2829797 RepID=A0ABQ4NKH7_9RHOB|nr:MULTISPECIES: N-(5'-phosphoribosyl)anthranilate isomerase [unclassified Jannaschia]GIT91082.1 hypothetical protein JANAI61_15400 [Jannaschia sp. AI_61]GIT94914.1 hypothetical protein JANAI62_15370 [Jannaschia sp. AI_62]
MQTHLDPERVLGRMFSTGKVAKGGVFHRAVRDVDRLVGRDRFLMELDRRGFQCLENGGQFVVFCNREPVRRIR